MPGSGEGGISNRKRPPVVLFIMPLLIGLNGFYRVTQSPQFESYRIVDVVQLLVSGACIGAVLTGLIAFFCGRGPATNLYGSSELEPNVKNN